MFNMNFAQRVLINADQLTWVESTTPGIEIKSFASEDGEHGHDTGILRYLPGTTVMPADNSGNKEILVLEGVYSDHTGDYGPGTYLRNPVSFQHQSFSKEGCLLFVKANQFQTGDTTRLCINTNEVEWSPGQGGLEVMPLHHFESESVALVKWPANERFLPHRHFGGEEVFVLSGTFIDEHGRYPRNTWIRSPHMSQHYPYVEDETIIWVKTGHLPVTNG